MYSIEFTRDALDDLKSLRKHQQKEVLDGIDEQLTQGPAMETRNRKRLLPNPVADWELRLGNLRVFYNVIADGLIVSIEAVGFRIGDLLFIRDVKTDL
jgi:mRNA-degrading endonuclease RelE of RelBE toxin-antitoxin system